VILGSVEEVARVEAYHRAMTADHS